MRRWPATYNFGGVLTTPRGGRPRQGIMIVLGLMVGLVFGAVIFSSRFRIVTESRSTNNDVVAQVYNAGALSGSRSGEATSRDRDQEELASTVREQARVAAETEKVISAVNEELEPDLESLALDEEEEDEEGGDCTTEIFRKTYDSHQDFFTTTSGCLALASATTIRACYQPKPRLLFHVNWNFLPNNNHDIISARVKILIKSIIVHHPRRSQVIVWTDDPRRARALLQDILSQSLLPSSSNAKRVIVRRWNNVEEAASTPLNTTMKYKNLQRNDERNWKGGDLMRILVLWKYGGVYIDMDTLVLRSFAPLLNQDFVYQWSCDRNEANGAVMYAQHPRSRMIQQFMDELPRVEDDAGVNFMWGKDLMSRVKHLRGGNFTILPACFFDPMWYNFDACDARASWRRWWSDKSWRVPQSNYPWHFDDFFNDKYPLYNVSAFFPGAFAVHWHNNWDKPNATLSPFSVIARDVEYKYHSLLLQGR